MYTYACIPFLDSFLALEDIQLAHETETRSSVLSIASDGIVARYESAVHLLDNPL